MTAARSVVCSECGMTFETFSNKNVLICPFCRKVKVLERRALPKSRAILRSLRIADIDFMTDREIEVSNALCNFEKYPFQEDAVKKISYDLGIEESELNSLIGRLYRRFGISGGNARRNFSEAFLLARKEHESN